MTEDTNFDTSLCLEMQFDEVEALSSIYGDAWKVDETSSGNYSIDIGENEKNVIMFITLPDTYPLGSPPVYYLSAPNLTKSNKDVLANVLSDTYLDNIGQCVLYQWIEKIREFLLSLSDGSNKCEELTETVEPVLEDALYPELRLPEIVHGSVINDRKSAFQGHLARVSNVDEVKLILASLKANKKISNATHNIFAYRIARSSASFLQDCEDDGETHAGGRLLHLLQVMNVCDVLVVVSRWYGGIHLGPDRFRHINNAARQVIEQAQIIPASTKQAR